MFKKASLMAARPFPCFRILATGVQTNQLHRGRERETWIYCLRALGPEVTKHSSASVLWGGF